MRVVLLTIDKNGSGSWLCVNWGSVSIIKASSHPPSPKESVGLRGGYVHPWDDAVRNWNCLDCVEKVWEAPVRERERKWNFNNSLYLTSIGARHAHPTNQKSTIIKKNKTKKERYNINKAK